MIQNIKYEYVVNHGLIGSHESFWSNDFRLRIPDKLQPDKCQLIVNEVLWRSSESQLTGNAHDIYYVGDLENY